MPKTTTSRLINQRLTAVHTLGHPTAPPPQTRWAQPAHGRAGEPSVATIVAPPPFAPNPPNPPALAQGNGTDLMVTWAGPAMDATHGPATGFNLQFSPSGAGAWTTLPNVASPYDLAGLAAGAAIDVQLQSTNAAGTSTWSATSTLTTATPGPYAPNAPAIVSVSPPADGTTSNLTVTWTAPTVDGTHGAATGYNLRTSPTGAGTWTTLTGVSSPYTITGLAGAAAIDVELQATNAASSPGPWSAITTGTTWGVTVTQGGWAAATTQVHGTSVAPNGGVQMFAVASPTPITGAAFAWSASNTQMPTSSLIPASSNGQTNGWGQWFNTPATAGTYYLWLLAQGANNTPAGALVTPAITVS
jgi:hypothetical protein